MSYGDGLSILWGNASGAFAGAEAGTAIEAVAADIADFTIPVPVTLLAYGFIIVDEVIDYDTLATAMVTSLDFLDTDTARTEIATITLSSALKYGDGNKAAFGAAANVEDGSIGERDVVMYRGTAFPKKLKAGAQLIFEHKTAAVGGTETGEYVPFVLMRIDGYDIQSTNILS